MKTKKLLALLFTLILPVTAFAAPITGYETTIADQKTTIETLAEPGQVVGPYWQNENSGYLRYYEQPALWWITDNTSEIEDLAEPHEKYSEDIVIDTPLMSNVIVKASKKKKHLIRHAHKHVGCVS